MVCDMSQMLNEKSKFESNNCLSVLLANTYLLYLKTQKCHWNVEGSNFASLHSFFQELYEELAEAVDLIAERIRSLGFKSPGSFAEFTKIATLDEKNQLGNADDMLQTLLHDNNIIINDIRGYIEKIKDGKDEGTIDLFIERLRAHEKSSWMIHSHII